MTDPVGESACARYNQVGLSPEVKSERRFHALSLDLWFTVLYYGPERDQQWREDRARLLRDSLRLRSGQQIEQRKVEEAIDSVHARLRSKGTEPITLDPGTLVPLYAGVLDAELTIPLDEFTRTYSSVGLREHPPIANPEAIAVVRGLTERNIPVMAITNTARRGSTWQEYLRDQVGLEFCHVISSCDCSAVKPDPAIFQEAARRTGVPPSEILHVGDRWELDVVGALGAGFGAMLYRGLWRFYPEGEYLETAAQVSAAPEVPCVDHLDEVLQKCILA